MAIDLQEIFNRAYRGLASQGFLQAFDEKLGKDGSPVNFDPSTGRRSALAWCMDEHGIAAVSNFDVPSSDIYLMALGLDTSTVSHRERCALLDIDLAHLLGVTPEIMRRRMHDAARWHNLTIPDITEPAQ